MGEQSNELNDSIKHIDSEEGTNRCDRGGGGSEVGGFCQQNFKDENDRLTGVTSRKILMGEQSNEMNDLTKCIDSERKLFAGVRWRFGGGVE